MSRTRKQQIYDLGLWAETRAALYFLCRGYKILKRRYKTPMGEIDLIARRGKTLAFIEVKARANTEDGLYAVSQKSQGRIEQAARHFLALHPAYNDFDMRFDLLVYSGLFSLRHLDNAWAARS